MATTETPPRPRAKKRPARSKQPPPRVDAEAAQRVFSSQAQRKFAVWFETFARIVDKEGEEIQPRVNVLQRRIRDAWEWCQEQGQACSLIVCKPRQGGCSTGSVGLGYHVCQSSRTRTRMRIMGGQYKHTKNLWTILKTFAERDKCPWPRGKIEVGDQVAKAEGIEISQETAGDKDAGRSGTYRVVIVTELGRWREKGVANAKKVLSGFLACCPRMPGTLRIIESTAQGVGGEFASRYHKAVTLEQWKAGMRGNGFIRIFAAWWEFEDYTKELDAEEARRLEADLSEEEREMRDRYALSPGQLAWRRETIALELDGDADVFKQEYPANEQEAFLSSGRPRFSRAGLDRQREISRAYRSLRSHGDISLSPDWQTAWVESEEEDSIFHRYEDRKEGLRYLVSVDTAEGATQAMGMDPDCHSVKVLRAGYYDERGQWRAPAVVMRIRPPRAAYRQGCRWDADVLEDAIYRAALYYGNCMIVVEMNHDIGVIELLKKRKETPGAPKPKIFARPVFNEREQRTTNALGWRTTSGNREAIVSGLAAAIRETGKEGGGIEIRCAHAIDECSHFERLDNGRSEAGAGWHDDDVLSLAIGLACIGQATIYTQPRVKRVDPADVKLLTRGKRRAKGQYR